MSDRKQSSVDDSEFDRELAATSRAYKSAAADLPPPAMDAAIRATARRAVKSQPRPVGKSWISRYSAPLSAAAMVVLTVSIGFVALDERPDLAPAVVSELAIPRPTEKAATPAPASAPESQATAKFKAPQATVLAQAAEKKALGKNRNAAQDQLVQPPTVDHARSRNEPSSGDAAALAKDLNVTQAPGRPTMARAPAPATATIYVPSAPAAPAPAPAPQPQLREAQSFVADPVAGASERKESTVAAESAKRELASNKQVSGQIAGLSGAERSDEKPAHKVQAQASASAPAPPALVSRTAVAPTVYAPHAAPAAPMADSAIELPDVWLKRILELKQQRKSREFEDELAKFRKRYPDFLLPQELK